MAADKADKVVITPDGKEPNNMVDIKLGEEKMKVVKSKKVLGVVIDNQLNFHEHIRVKAEFKALESLDNFIKVIKVAVNLFSFGYIMLWYFRSWIMVLQLL